MVQAKINVFLREYFYQKNDMSEKIKYADFISARKQETTKLIEKLRTISQTCPEEKLLRNPAPGKWSVAQVLEHLVKYNRYYLPAIEKGISKNAHQEAAEYYSPGWLGAYFTKLMLPEKPGRSIRKMQSPKEYRPSNMPEPGSLIAEFIEGEEKLLSLLELSRTVNLAKTKVPISLNRFVHLQLGDVFHFLLAHQIRHFYQIEEALKQVAKPPSAITQ